MGTKKASTFFAMIALCILMTTMGCKSNRIAFVVGDIEGPGEIDELAATHYSVTVQPDYDVTYLWSVNPPEAGQFNPNNTASTEFTPADIEDATQVEIWVVVSSGVEGMAIKKKIITITALGLRVSGITGPTVIDDKMPATFSVEAECDSEITYNWKCDPPGAGVFGSPDSHNTTFLPDPVMFDVLAELTVDVDATGYDTVERVLGIRIIDAPYGWAVSWGSDYTDYSTDMVMDDAGNLFITGYFTNIVDFDPGPGIELHTDGGCGDAFLSKFDSDGNFLWARNWGNTKRPFYAKKAAVDPAGNCYVLGQGYYPANLDPGPGIDVQDCRGILLVKYDPEGNYLWGRTWGNNWEDQVLGIAVDNWSNVFAFGSFKKSIDLDPGPGTDYHEPAGINDIFLNAFDADGNFKWGYAWGTDEDQIQGGVTVNSAGDIFITGRTYYHEYYWACIQFIQCISTSGELVWEKYWDSHQFLRPSGITVDDSDNIIIAGTYFDDADFDPGPGSDIHQGQGHSDAFITKLGPSGDYLWTKTWGGNDAYVYNNSINTDGKGNIYLAGRFTKSVDFNPEDDDDILTSNGDYDFFLSKFDSDGEFQFAHSWGDLNQWAEENATAIGVNQAGDIFVTGYFAGMVDFNPTGSDDFLIAEGYLYRDAFLCKFPPDILW
jgi:hypothetical protein